MRRQEEPRIKDELNPKNPKGNPVLGSFSSHPYGAGGVVPRHFSSPSLWTTPRRDENEGFTGYSPSLDVLHPSFRFFLRSVSLHSSFTRRSRE